jgi:Plasmid pRiA4b ORF-3-like protein
MEMTSETKTHESKTQACVYELRITLRESRPPIWRLVQVPDALRLNRLHNVLQTVIGWTDSHLHRFEKDGKHWGVPEHDGDDEIDQGNEMLRRPPVSLTVLCKQLAPNESLIEFVLDARTSYALRLRRRAWQSTSFRAVCRSTDWLTSSSRL